MEIDKIGWWRGEPINQMSRERLLDFAAWAGAEIERLQKVEAAAQPMLLQREARSTLRDSSAISRVLATRNVAAVLLAVVMVFGFAFAFAKPAKASEPEIGFRVLDIPNSDYWHLETRVVKFVDPDNGNVCYITQPVDGRAGAGISCIKS